MPDYEFVCRECDAPFTVHLTLAEYENRGEVQCPKCQSRRVDRIWSSTGVITSKKS